MGTENTEVEEKGKLEGETRLRDGESAGSVRALPGRRTSTIRGLGELPSARERTLSTGSFGACSIRSTTRRVLLL